MQNNTIKILDEFGGNLDDLCDEIINLRNFIEEKDKKIDDLEKDNATLEENNDELASEKKELEGKIDDLELQVKDTI